MLENTCFIKNTEMDINPINKEAKQNTCNFCSKDFKTLKALNRHKKSHIKVCMYIYYKHHTSYILLEGTKSLSFMP